MSPPNPKQPSSDDKNTFKSFIDAFGKLPAVLAFTGLFLLAIILLIMKVNELPGWSFFLVLFFGGLVFFVIVAFGNRWLDMKENEADKETAAQEPNPPPPPADDQPTAVPLAAVELETQYLKDLIYRCGWVSTTAFDPKARHAQAEKLHLASVFTELDVPREQRQETLSARPPDDIEKASRQPALLSVSRYPQLVLLGKAGSGKSTLINYVALCLAAEKAGETNRDFNLAKLVQLGWDLPALLPLRVILRDYAARGLPANQSLWQFIEAELGRISDGRNHTLTPYAPHLEKTLQQKGGLLLLDGYDEVPEAHRRRELLKEAIFDFQRCFEKVHILVTSRPYAYTDPDWQLPGFARTELLDFSPEQVQNYIERWYQAMEAADPNLTAEQVTAFTDQLQQEVGGKGNPNLRELAPRPLLLAQMCSLHRSRGGGALPDERHQLYEENVELLLDLWERPKLIYDTQGQEREERSALLELGIAKKELRQVLNQVAYEVHKEQADNLAGTADIPERKLAGLLLTASARKENVSYERIVHYVKNRAGLLEDRGPDRQGQHIYTFPHRTFQEYLAACYLSGKTFPGEIATLARQNPNRWREALLLAAGRANTDYSVWGLVGKLCPPQNPPASFATIADNQWQGVFLAGQVLMEKKLTAPVADGEDEARRQRVQMWHKAILEQGALPPPDRALAGNSLAALGDDRPGVLRCDEMRFCTVPAGDFWLQSWDKKGQSDWYAALNKPYWLAQYTVTSAQFREFVADSNYQPTRSDSLLGSDNEPVIWVNWYDALAFCEWLDARWRRRGWLPDGYCVTLPSETEWEKAARGGRHLPRPAHIIPPNQLVAAAAAQLNEKENRRPQRPYPWGDDSAPEKSDDHTAIYHANDKNAGIGRVCAVGSFPAGRSPVGCLDMSGNVWEWTRNLTGKPFPPQLTPEFETADSRNK
ncbi:MAG: SUMF1/EgtB/PvdO family nonheme iron enzyme, partial [Chloroflexi bacterium]|nr:SUMF1/EgtB/PvdO family nonheme iron enzyme [Chloroflexota bacterium]